MLTNICILILYRSKFEKHQKMPKKTDLKGLLHVIYKASDVDPDGIATVKSFIVSQI